MCYALPGPRCSSHARQSLRSAIKAFNATRADAERHDAWQHLKECQREFDSTPVGQRLLRKALAQNDDPKGILRDRLARAERNREESLKAHAHAQAKGTLRARDDENTEVKCLPRTTVSMSKLPLKDLDGTMMTLAIQEAVVDFAPGDRQMVHEALSLAAYLHRDKVRQNPTRNSQGRVTQPTSPYIEHPLRNTLRLSRWGCKDANVLAASLLHDTVEDHPEGIVSHYTDRNPDEMSPEEQRRVALTAIEDNFNPEVSQLVRAVSNPIQELPDMTREQKNAVYLEHVTQEVLANPKVFLVKFADFSDNALSFHHHVPDAKARARATKYLPLAGVFQSGSKMHDEALNSSLSASGREKMKERIASADGYLRRIISDCDLADTARKAQAA
jgi:HD domain